ncbi:flagellar biosynthesis anti-sigma factor FlgM [Hydrogenibacillus sp. N12]|uniref:flagellar biosynthesis anti-sigma factor FlgM n=1 Tax=Hydrogenibacillus sp. N12 TaxID=2866627 RepID=UPI001C7D07B8|nr:flagellar biosynthesis anti-sigma factor FlgM [Hydrogenibacillus sp. N12]QZA33201.1 flagellar biosynthesis anti-sigma factor FlgM [Hydrogenibacillus sp. N12]
MKIDPTQGAGAYRAEASRASAGRTPPPHRALRAEDRLEISPAARALSVEGAGRAAPAPVPGGVPAVSPPTGAPSPARSPAAGAGASASEGPAAAGPAPAGPSSAPASVGAPLFGAAGDRAQRLQALRQAVEQGAYRPDPAAIAEALLRALAGGRRADR